MPDLTTETFSTEFGEAVVTRPWASRPVASSERLSTETVVAVNTAFGRVRLRADTCNALAEVDPDWLAVYRGPRTDPQAALVRARVKHLLYAADTYAEFCYRFCLPLAEF